MFEYDDGWYNKETSYWYAREHDWNGGWSVRNKHGIVALVFDKLVAVRIAGALTAGEFVVTKEATRIGL